MKEPDYVVINGVWFDRNEIPQTVTGRARLPEHMREADDFTRYEASGLFEVREDGKVAEVWVPVD